MTPDEMREANARREQAVEAAVRLILNAADHVHYTYSVIRFPLAQCPLVGVTRIFAMSRS